MKRLFFKMLLTAVLSMFAFQGHGQCEMSIEDFYIAYMNNLENDETSNVKLLQSHMSPELIAKLKSSAQQLDADAVIHAQDVCKHCIQSLTVVPLKENWYMVKYKWDPQSDYTCIPVKATETDGRLIILDISAADTIDLGVNTSD